MKQSIKYLFTIIAIVAGLKAIGQSNDFNWQNISVNSNRLAGKLTGTTFLLSTQSNAYFFYQKDWIKGMIETEDGDVFNNVSMRYFARDDELVFFNDNVKDLFTVDKEIVKSFSYNNTNGKEIRFVKLLYKNLTGNYRYFRQVYKGKTALLAYHSVEEIKVNPFSDAQGVLRDTEFRPRISYYLYSENTGILPIQENRKSFIKIFFEQKKEIRKLFRTSGLRNFDEQGLIQAVRLLEDAGIMK